MESKERKGRAGEGREGNRELGGEEGREGTDTHRLLPELTTLQCSQVRKIFFAGLSLPYPCINYFFSVLTRRSVS